MFTIYLSIFAGSGFFSGVGLFLTLYYLSPETFPLLAPLMLFICLFLFGASTFTLINYFIRRFMNKKLNKYMIFHISIRQGTLLSLYLTIAALLLHLQAFTWWSALLLLIILFFVELYFLTKEHIEN